MIEGWRFNPPPSWPKPPGHWMPPPDWQPDPAWGPVPPGWQVWVADRRGPRHRWGLSATGWGTLLAIVVVVLLVPRAPGPDDADPRAGGVSLVRVAATAEPRPTATGTKTPTKTPTPTKMPRPTPTSTLALTMPTTPPPTVDPNRRFLTCSAMHRVYPHGLGLPTAVDRSHGTPVTDFGRSTSLYRANQAHDRDHDGIACEPS